MALMAELGVRAYRFSIAWPRIQPEGRGSPNARGLDFYRRLMASLHAHGIVPVPTLYHWDMPQALEDAGGWPVRDTALRFADYATAVYGALGAEAPLWITLNEPWCSAWLGYGSGVHAPGRDDPGAALAATHHLLLADAWARETMDGGPGETGIALNIQPTRPASDDPEDVRAAHLADLQMNALYLDPLFGRGYPRDLVEHYRDVTDLGFVRNGDLDAIHRPPDFLGVNYYRIHTVTADPDRAGGVGGLAGALGAWSFPPPGVPVTALDWPIEPFGLTDLLVDLHREYAPRRILVTENGAAFEDRLGPGGAIDDRDRIAYLAEHVDAARRALAAGVPLEGFFVWSLLDNFEWAEGYSCRFGLVHVDFDTQVRRQKASARWFQDLIRGASGATGPPQGGGSAPTDGP